MHELIRRARRRFLNQELMSQGANTFSTGLAAFIVLLLLGTEVLNWYWAALIPLAKAENSKIIEINPDETPYSEMVDCSLRGPAGEILPRLVN